MFNELIDASNTSLKEGLFTALPAVIIKVHSGNELRYDIQPTISQKNKDGEDKPYTAIYHVPAALPKSVTGGLSFELSVGDGVLAIFSQRGLEAWKSIQGKLKDARNGVHSRRAFHGELIKLTSS